MRECVILSLISNYNNKGTLMSLWDKDLQAARQIDSYASTAAHKKSASEKMRTSKYQIVGLDRAIEMFDEIVEKYSSLFNDLRSGCYCRAHVICDYLFDKSIKPKKAWVYGDCNEIKFKGKVNDRKFDWWYHVATVIEADIGNGETQKIVFDPSLFDGPVDVGQWLDLLNKPEAAEFKVLEYDEAVPDFGHMRYGGSYTLNNAVDSKRRNAIISDIETFSTTVERDVVKSKLREDFDGVRAAKIGHIGDLKNINNRELSLKF